MPKGRRCVPPTERDGVWFQHRGLPDHGPQVRELSTCTGLMLNGPFRETSAVYPPLPPKAYKEKDARNFKNTNDFSTHDNRNSLQDHGVYFGDGHRNRHLGKQIVGPTLRQHFTDKDYLKHRGRIMVAHDYASIYGSDFQGEPTEKPPVHRRFPRIHKEGVPGPGGLTSGTGAWHSPPDVPATTPLHVLTVTQEPFLPANKWKYSYHSVPQCYPQYDHLGKNSSYAIWNLNAPSVRQAKATIKTLS